MTEKQKKILRLIELKKNILELKSSLNISDKEIIRTLNSLINQGYNIENGFDQNIGHYLQLSNSINNQIKIGLNNQNTEFSVLAISDTHFLSLYEDVKAVDRIYDFAAKKGIKYVFHMGDFIHGKDSKNGYTFTKTKFLELLKEYPQDNYITTFLILGNHDFYPLRQSNYNISNVIKNNRLDLIPLENKNSKIVIGNSNIGLYHKDIPYKKEENRIVTLDSIILKGHQHIFKLEEFINENNRNGLIITVPSVTNMVQDKGNEVLQKGFVQLDLTIKNNKIDSSTVMQYMIENSPVRVGEFHHEFQKIKKD